MATNTYWDSNFRLRAPRIRLTDASSTPSPQTLVAATPLTLAVPANLPTDATIGVRLVVTSDTVLTFSLDGITPELGSYLLKANVETEIPLEGIRDIYLTSAAGGDLNFMFLIA
jgi:hypothetical protein